MGRGKGKRGEGRMTVCNDRFIVKIEKKGYTFRMDL